MEALGRKSAYALTGVMAVCLLVALGCAKKEPPEQMAEKMIERAIRQSAGADAEIDFRGDKILIKGEQGENEMSFGETKWPKDLPNDVPEFKLAKVKGVNRFEREGKKGWNIVLEEIRDKAFQKYVEQLEGRGWTVMNDMTTGEGGMLQASKGGWLLVGMYNKAEAKGIIGVSMQ